MTTFGYVKKLNAKSFAQIDRFWTGTNYIVMLEGTFVAIGNSIGIVLPKVAMSKLKRGKGDDLCLVQGPDGLTLTSCKQEFAEQMEATERVMKITATHNVHLQSE